MGFVVPWQMGSSQTRDRTYIPCIDRQILNHWTTRAVQRDVFWVFSAAWFLSSCGEQAALHRVVWASYHGGFSVASLGVPLVKNLPGMLQTLV